MQHFIKNPYPPPKPPEHEKIIKLKPTWENQPKKIIKPPTQKNVKPRNLQPRTWTSFFMFFSKSRQTQLTNPLKINLSTKSPYPQIETTTNNQNNHHNHPHHQPQQPQITTKNPPLINLAPTSKSQTQTQTKPKTHTKTQNTQTKSKFQSKTQTIRRHCHHHYHHQHLPLPNPYPQTQIIIIKKKNKKNQN